MGQGPIHSQSTAGQQVVEFGGCKLLKRADWIYYMCVYVREYSYFSHYYSRCVAALQSQNTIAQLAKLNDSIEMLELKDDLALTLQLADQYTYNNAFVYYQPGNGKFSIKEPQQLARKAMTQIQDILDLVEDE